MKLIYIANIRIPSARAHGLQVMKTCEAFATLGHEVELLVTNSDNGSDPFDYYGVERNFKIKKIPSFGNAALGRLSYGLNFVSFIFLVGLYLLWIKIRSHKKVVVYARGEAVLFLGLISRFIFPVFWETHIKPPAKSLKRYLRIASKVWGVITVTDFYRHELVETYKIKPNVLWAPDGVTLEEVAISLSQTEARKDLELPTDKKIVVYTGSFYLYDYKGLDVLLAAAKLLPDDYLTILVGGTKPEIEKIKRENGESKILAISHVPHKQIAKYLCSANVLVLPNKKGDEVSEKYTSPMKLFEYMAARRPIVCSNVGSLREILDDNSAFIFEANDSNDFAKKIIQSQNDSSEADRRTEKAFELSKQYAWTKRSGKILDFMNDQIK